MTPQQIEAMKQALEELYPIAHNTTDDPRGQAYKAITALEEVLAQPEQDPICPDCKAKVLYECVACSSNNYPPKENA